MEICEKLNIMTKYLLLLSLLLCSFSAIGSEENLNDPEGSSFEAELRMLEQRDEAAFRRAEKLTERELSSDDDLLSDTVSTTNAAVKREEATVQRSDMLINPPAYRPRRIRSR